MNSDRATGIRITAARYGISEAGTVSPSVSVNGQARPFALTPCVPLSRRAGEGGLWSAEAELPPVLKLRFSTPNRSLREGNQAARPFGSPCEQGEP